MRAIAAKPLAPRQRDDAVMRAIVTLKKALLRIEELPQTTQNTTAMGQALWDLLSGRNLRIYPSAELREQALNTVAVEARRGWRIAKERGSRKIDAIVALAMASYAAISHGRPISPSGGTLRTFADAARAERSQNHEETSSRELVGFFGSRRSKTVAAGAARRAGILLRADGDSRARRPGFWH